MKKVATYIGFQDCGGIVPGFRLFNLLIDLYENGELKHCVGSTVSESTLRKYLIQVPNKLEIGDEF
jgi:hypothetical protein